MDADGEKVQRPKNIASRYAASAALKTAHRLKSSFEDEHSKDKKLAKNVLSILALFLIAAVLYETFNDDPIGPYTSYHAKIVDLYKNQNKDSKPWYAKIIKIKSEKLGIVYAEVTEELYPTLELGDEIEVGEFERESTIKFSVIGKVIPSAP